MDAQIEYFQKVGKKVPNLIARINFPNTEPFVRAYIYNYNFYPAFQVSDTVEAVEKARDHLIEIIEQMPRQPAATQFKSSKYQFAIAVIWGLAEERRIRKMTDFIGHLPVENWPGVPDRDFFSIIDKNLVNCGTRYTRELGNTDYTVILGAEEEYRRKTRHPETYAKNAHKVIIPGLEVLDSLT